MKFWKCDRVFVKEREDRVAGWGVFPDEIGQEKGVGPIYTVLVVGGRVPWLGANRADRDTADARAVQAQGRADLGMEATVFRDVCEQTPWALGKIGSMVVVLLRTLPLLMRKNDLDGALVTKKVTDGAVGGHSGHTSPNRMKKIWERGRNVWDAAQERTRSKKGVGLRV